MRNLKRALSLTLASVMLLGMMVVGSSALSFNDADDISNVTAATVLQELGVMIGNDGNFMPDAPVSRAQMAILICRVLYGDKLNVKQFEGMTSFTDVPAYEYYNGYINLATSLGIINGYGDGRFGPDDTVTTAQAALMLCRALGYFKAGEMTGNWGSDALAAVAQATKLDMFGELNLPTNELLSRDNVAEMVFNTMTKAVPVQYSERWDMYYTDSKSIMQGVEFKYTNTLGYENFDLVYAADEDDFGRPATEWGTGSVTKDLTDKGHIDVDANGSSVKNSFIKSADAADFTYTAHVKAADVKKDLKGYSIENNTVTARIDGGDGTAKTTIDALATYLDDTLTGKGVTVSIYTNSAKEITDVVVINAYFGKVTKVAEKDGETTVTVNKLAGGSKTAKTFESTAFAKDDYVLYTVGNDGSDDVIKTMTAVEGMEGEITATSGDSYLRLDGNKYDYNKNAKAEDIASVNDVELGDATIYLDNDGNVIYVGKVEAAAKQYFFVKGADLYMNDVSVKAVFADGTTEVITISGDTYVKATVTDNAGDKTISGSAEFGTKAFTGAKKLSDASYDEVRDEIATVMLGQVFSYTKSDNEYKVADLGDNGGDSTSVELKKGNNAIDTGVTANNNTVYVVTSNGNTYTGYRNLPSMENVDLFYVLDEKNTDIATLVFIVNKDDADDENAFWFYVADETKFESKKDGDDIVYTLTAAYVNGEPKNVVVAEDIKASIDAKGLYKATKANTKDVVTELGTAGDAPVALDDMKADQATAVGAGTLVVDGTNYTYDDKTLFIYVKDEDVDVIDTPESYIIKYDEDAEEGDDMTWVYVAETDDDDTYITKVVYIIADEVVPCEHSWSKTNATTHTCSKCGATGNHEWGTGDATNHKCSICQGEEAHSFSKTNDSIHTCATCTKTGDHTVSTWTNDDDAGDHKGTCSVCSGEVHQAHSWAAGAQATDECQATGCDKQHG